MTSASDVKAHVGHEPNEVADTLAKEGASTGKVEALLVPKVIIRNQIETLFQNKWQIRWKNLSSWRQTKFWISKPGIMGKQIQMLGQATPSNVIQALTGHNYLNYHCSQMDRSLSETCRFCGEGHEEFIHLTCECPALAKDRLEHIYELQLSTPPNLASLVRLMRVNRIAKAMEGRTE